MTLKIKVGTLTLTAARDVDLPQEFAAWHQTVRVEPGTYDVFAYLEWSDGALQVRDLAAPCDGITISSNFRSHMFGTWGKSDNNRNGQRATAHIRLPTYGTLGAGGDSDLEATTLCDALVREEWDAAHGRMWRFTWNPARKPVVIEAARYGGGTSLAAFEDTRRFAVDGVAMAPGAVMALRLAFPHIFGIDQFTVGEQISGWDFNEKRSRVVERLA